MSIINCKKCNHPLKESVFNNIEREAELRKFGKYPFVHEWAPYIAIRVSCPSCTYVVNTIVQDSRGNFIERVKRLPIKQSTKEHLLTLSRNQCAFPTCTHQIVNKNGHFTRHVCHIEAAEIGGQRFNPLMSNEERRQFANLVLMCPTHHSETDDVSLYTVEKMRDIKRSHEQLALRSSESNNVIEAEFVDYSLSETKCFPESLSALTLDACDHANEEFFNDSIYYMTLIAQLPRKSREFYVYALSRAAYYEYSISFSWMELARHLRVSEEQVLKEIGILENHKLMRREMEDLRYKDLCWFQFFDCKDNGVFFLKAVLDAFGDDIELLYDTFCEMNFSNLES